MVELFFSGTEIKLIAGLVPVGFVIEEKDASGNWVTREWGILHMSCVPDDGGFILKDGVKYRANKKIGRAHV